MEKIKPFRGKSSISSLKFQQKSDFKRFLNFIKNQTEELKGIAEPKENKVQGILGAGATGLGILGIGALLLGGGKGEGDDLETAKGIGGGLDLFAAIGRRNVPGIKSQGISTLGKPGRVKVESQFKRTRERPQEEVRAIKKRLTTTRTAAEEKAIQERGKRNITNRLTQNISRQETSSRIVPKEIQRLKGGQRVLTATGLADEGLKDRPKSRYSDYGSRKRFSKSKTGFPKTNVKFYGNMGFQKFFGGTRIGEVRPKPGFKIDPLSGDIIPIDPIEQIIREAETDPNIRKQFLKDSGLDDLNKRLRKVDPRRKLLPSEKFSKIRRGTRTFARPDPFGRITGTLTKNVFPEKSGISKFSRRLMRGNPKITKDSFLGISYKGPKFSMLAKAVSNPAVKVVLFGLDLLNTLRAGGQVFNPRDNLAVSLYDLYVSINNSIFKDDPEKLKLYQSVSSNEKIMVKQVRRNAEIMRRQNEAVQKKFLEATGKGSNNIIVVPQSNNQGGGAGGGSTKILNPTGGNEISFVPFEPLNIGDDILLHKLNQ